MSALVSGFANPGATVVCYFDQGAHRSYDPAVIFGSGNTAFWVTVATWVVSLGVAPWLANRKARSLLAWLALTFFFGLLALLVLAALPQRGTGQRRGAALDLALSPERSPEPRQPW
jgi:hypothetical protein